MTEAVNLTGAKEWRMGMGSNRPSWVAPLMAGDITTEAWEVASNKVWNLRIQYPPDSLSAIFRDIAIRLQAELDEKVGRTVEYEQLSELRASLKGAIAALRQSNVTLLSALSQRDKAFKEAEQAESALAQKTRECEELTKELEAANNEFGSETAHWPKLWKRIAELKSLLNQRQDQVEQLERQVAELKDELLETGEGREYKSVTNQLQTLENPRQP